MLVTTLADGRGQTTLKGREITAEWENLIRKAAERTNTTIAGFVVSHTTPIAQAFLKDELVGPVALPIRLEDLADRVTATADQVAALAAEQAARDGEQLARHTELLREVERQARRGRWRR